MDLNLKKVIKQIKKYTKLSVKKSRYEHSVRVAKMCKVLCRHYGLDVQKGYLIGIAHDMCKDYSDEQMVSFAKTDGKPVSDFELKKPALLHGRCAAIRMKNVYGIFDKDLLEAVEYHTFGIIDMKDYAKVLFAADKIEPGRAYSTKKYRKELMALSLDQMFIKVLTQSFDYVVRKGYEIIPQSQKVAEYYRKKD